MKKLSLAEIEREKQANAFACALLMPKNIFIEQCKKLREEGNHDDELLVKLADTFQVPIFSVVWRMGMLETGFYQI